LVIEDEELFEFFNGYFSVHGRIKVFLHVLFERLNQESFHAFPLLFSNEVLAIVLSAAPTADRPKL
jgi:hypothetical protein